MYLSDKLVRTGPVIIQWDGITEPETTAQNKIKHSLTVLIENTRPEKAELEAIADAQLRNGEFRGVLPAGAHPAMKPADHVKLGDPKFANYTKFSANTTRGIPPIVDTNGKTLSPMEYGPMLYAGAIVELIVDAYDYNNVQKGITFGIHGVMIIDANAEKLAVAGGMSAAEVTAAFTGGATGAPAATAPAPGAPAATAPAPGAPAATAPAPDTALTAPAAPVGPQYQMTATAVDGNGVALTREQYHNAGWTDEQLIAGGYMVQV